MCGRYTHLMTWAEIYAYYSLFRGEGGGGDDGGGSGDESPQPEPPGHKKSWNVAPGTDCLVIVQNERGREGVMMYWGFVPSWASDPKQKPYVIARGETVATSPAFRSAFKSRRCLVPVSSFYEWKLKPGAKGKQPHYVGLKSGQPFALAGVWEHWAKGEKPRDGFCIITVEPNSVVSAIHDRMPVIIDQEHFDQWLTGTPEEAAKLLRTYPAENMTAHPVSERVNKTSNNSPDLIQPVAPSEGPRDLFS